MSFYKNPFIGWFMKQRILKILLVFIISIIFTFVFFFNYQHSISDGCTRQDCYTTPCSGNLCQATGCKGNNCKAGDCYGEECEAGDCEGIGCRAGDCYGLNCFPGKCIDPTCRGERKLRNKCKPFCLDGRAYTLPKTEAYHIIKYLPKDTILNPNFCSKKKKVFIFDSENIHNFTVDYINLYTSGYIKFEDWLIKDKLQKGKSFVLTDDSQFLNTIPDVYKNENCEWATNFKNIEITSEFKPYFNIKNKEYTWIKKNLFAMPLNDQGNEENCTKPKPKGEPKHTMKIVSNYNVRYKINNILATNKAIHEKNFEIDSILGEELVLKCEDCDKRAIQYLDIKSHPTELTGKIKPCKIRVYEVKQILDEFEQPISHYPTGFISLTKDSDTYRKYLEQNVNVLKTFREHHLWEYLKTEGNSQVYKCYWCSLYVRVDNQSLPRKNNLELDYCRTANDFNHYMYHGIDSNKTIFQKCLKCGKKSYPIQQKNI